MSSMGYLVATDWAKITADATVALAVVTAVLAVAAIVAAVFTWRGLRTAADDLRATQEATTVTQEMAQRQIDASYRPLLIDVPPYGPLDPNDPLVPADSPRIRLDFPGGHTDVADPRQIYVQLSGPRANIAIPLRNVGQGLRSSTPPSSASSDNGLVRWNPLWSSGSASRQAKSRGSCARRVWSRPGWKSRRTPGYSRSESSTRTSSEARVRSRWSTLNSNSGTPSGC